MNREEYRISMFVLDILVKAYRRPLRCRIVVYKIGVQKKRADDAGGGKSRVGTQKGTRMDKLGFCLRPARTIDFQLRCSNNIPLFSSLLGKNKSAKAERRKRQMYS